MVEEAVKALGKVAEAHLRISIDSHSPSKLSKSIGGDWDEGFAIGIEEGIPDVSAVSANMANAAVSSTLGIMNAQGAAAVSAYTPRIATGVCTPLQQQAHQPLLRPVLSRRATSLFQSALAIETLETVVVNAITRDQCKQWGWSV